MIVHLDHSLPIWFFINPEKLRNNLLSCIKKSEGHLFCKKSSLIYKFNVLILCLMLYKRVKKVQKFCQHIFELSFYTVGQSNLFYQIYRDTRQATILSLQFIIKIKFQDQECYCGRLHTPRLSVPLPLHIPQLTWS